MACNKTPLSEFDQMRFVADSLNPTGSRFDREISYEINGCILTWIANYSGYEHRFECSNIIEIIDGYYKAEFYLDTKRLFDVPKTDITFSDNADVEFTDSVPNGTRKFKITTPKSLECSPKIDTISTVSTDADSPNDNLNTSKGERSEQKIFTPKKSQHIKLNKSDKLKKKVSVAPKKAPTLQPPVTIGFTLRSSRNNRSFTPSNNIYSKENTSAFSYTRYEISKTGIQDPTKKRKYTKTDPTKKNIPSQIRRGDRIRKVNVFQDYYIPTTKNQWIPEVFIGADKENF